MENKNKILGYVAMGAGALMIISLFLPYVSAFGTSQSLWKLDDGSRVLFLLLGLAVAALYVFNKKTELTYMAAGYGLFHSIAMAIQAEGLDYFAIGYYTLFIAATAMLVVTLMYDEKKGTALFNLNISRPAPAAPTYTQAPVSNPTPVQNPTTPNNGNE